MKLRRFDIPPFLIFVVCILSTTVATAATVEESARAEGEVVLYSSLNNEQIVTLVDGFKKKYPFIKPSFYRATSERVLQRVLTEAKAGRYAVDVFTAAGFQLQLMKEAGLTQKFVPAGSRSLRRWLQRSGRALGQRTLPTQHHGLQHAISPAERSAEKIRRSARAKMESKNRRQSPRPGMVRESSAALGQGKSQSIPQGSGCATACGARRA